MDNHKNGFSFKAALLAAFVFVLSYVGTSQALYPDPEVNAGLWNVISSGQALWKAGVNSSGQFVITENNNINAPLLTIDDSSGAMLMRTRTTAQLATLTPSAAGEVIVNSSYPALCISTGATVGAWVMVSSYTAAGGNPANKVRCTD